MKYSREQIKEIILTDYLDGQLDVATKREIDRLIDQDPQLAEFLNVAKQALREPFKNIEKEQPPEHVWQNIKKEIEATQQQENAPSILEDCWRRLAYLWERPRLSFALGSVMTVLIVFLWVGTGRFVGTPVQYNSEDQIENLMFLAGGDLVDSEDVTNGFHTSIEEYFL